MPQTGQNSGRCKESFMALKLFPIFYCYRWQGWKWIILKLLKNHWAKVSICVFKNRQKKTYYVWFLLIKFMWYLCHSFTGAFCWCVKALFLEQNKTAKPMWRNPFLFKTSRLQKAAREKLWVSQGLVLVIHRGIHDCLLITRKRELYNYSPQANSGQTWGLAVPVSNIAEKLHQTRFSKSN